MPTPEIHLLQSWSSRTFFAIKITDDYNKYIIF